MQKIQSGIFYTIMASEVGHIFCCVIPSVLSLIALSASFGLVIALPDALLSFHHMMHKWELLIISFSGFLLALGWILFWISLKLNNNEDECCNSNVQPPFKIRTIKIMVVVSLLFSINLGIYMGVHKQTDIDFNITSIEHVGHAHEHHS